MIKAKFVFCVLSLLVLPSYADVFLYSDGTSSTVVGNTILNSDGISSTMVGNTILNSDGSSVSVIGN